MRSVKPLRVTEAAGVALDRDQTRALLSAVADHRLGAAVSEPQDVGDVLVDGSSTNREL